MLNPALRVIVSLLFPNGSVLGLSGLSMGAETAGIVPLFRLTITTMMGQLQNP